MNQKHLTEHSPTPWHGMASLLDRNDRWIGGMNKKYDHDLVLHRVNSHDKLVEACQAASKYLHLTGHPEDNICAAVVAQVEAALAEEQK